VESNFIGQYKYKLTNNAPGLKPCRYELKFDANRISKYFLSMPRFEPGSLRLMLDASANLFIKML
jgi:hypothetical protein